MLANILKRDVTITHKSDSATLDAYGNVIPDLSTVTVQGELQERRRSEDAAGVISDDHYTLFLLPGVELTTGDEVIIDGLTYELDGAPWVAFDPLIGQPHHIEATLRRTAGATEVS